MRKLKSFIRQHFKSEFARNVLTVFTGISFAQIIPVFVSPILTRLYTPEEFGILALFVSTGAIFGSIATFQYDAAIMLPKEDKDAINLLALSIFLTLLMTLFSFIIVLAFNAQLAALMDNQKVSRWLYLVPLTVVLTGVFRSFSVWAARNKQFRLIAVRNVTQTSTTAGVKLASGFAKYTSGGLIVGSLTGQFVATALLAVEFLKRSAISIKAVNWKAMIQNAKKYKDFPLFTNWQGFFDMVNETGSRYIISNIFGSVILGWYSFTFGLLQKPLGIIGQSVAQVFYQKGAQVYNKRGDLWLISKKIIVRLALIGSIIFLPIFLFGKDVFAFIFGNEWANAGVYAQLMVPWSFARFVLSPLSNIPMILGKQKQFFFYSIGINIIIPINFYIVGYTFNNFKLALLTNSLTIFALYFVVGIWFRQITIKRNT